MYTGNVSCLVTNNNKQNNNQISTQNKNLQQQGWRAKRSSSARSNLRLQAHTGYSYSLGKGQQKQMVSSVRKELNLPGLAVEEPSEREQTVNKAIKESKKLSKRQQKNARKKERQVKLKATRLESQLQENMQSVSKYFTPISTNHHRIQLTDFSGFTKDFRTARYLSKKPEERIAARKEIGQMHMAKRLTSFYTLADCSLGFMAKANLGNYKLWMNRLSKGKFKAESAVCPPSSNSCKNNYQDFERTHISLLNKIPFYKEEKKFKLVDINIKLNINSAESEKLININEYLNMCNIAPKTVNSIDSILEFLLRNYALNLIDLIGKKELDSEDAKVLFTRAYGRCLCYLQNCIKVERFYINLEEDENEIIPRELKDRLGDLNNLDSLIQEDLYRLKADLVFNLKEIVKDQEANDYIDGMLNALTSEISSFSKDDDLRELDSWNTDIPNQSWADIDLASETEEL